MYNHDNIFAKIIRGEIPCQMIYQNDHALSFFDINPIAKIHALVVPKGEYIGITDFLEQATLEEKNSLLSAISETIRQLNLASTGYRVISNCGFNGGQEVSHLHFHILGGEKLNSLK